MAAAAHRRPLSIFPPQARQRLKDKAEFKRQRARVLIIVLGLAILTGLAVEGAGCTVPEEGFSEPQRWHSFAGNSPC